MNIPAVHLALIKQAASLARNRTALMSERRKWAQKCVDLIGEYRKRYGHESATRDTRDDESTAREPAV